MKEQDESLEGIEIPCDNCKDTNCSDCWWKDIKRHRTNELYNYTDSHETI